MKVNQANQSLSKRAAATASGVDLQALTALKGTRRHHNRRWETRVGMSKHRNQRFD